MIFLRTFEAICLLLATLALFALASMLALSVLERRRELGVLRVLGATPRRLFCLILMEGLLIVLLGCALAAVLSIPISLLLGDQSGRMFVGTPLGPGLSLGGYLSWLVILLTFGALACWVPGRRAAQQRIRQLL